MQISSMQHYLSRFNTVLSSSSDLVLKSYVSNSASMRYYILLGLLAVAAAHPRTKRGIIHDETPQLEEKLDHGLIGESSHAHHIQHEHAKSHQSIKFEHFHPVPVYVKKEHSHLLKHPLEKGKFEHNLKLVHPETEHKYGGGLVLEDHRLDTDHSAGFHDHSDNVEEIVHLPEHGSFGGEEGLKAWGEGAEQHGDFSQQFGQGEGGHYEYQQLEGHGAASQGGSEGGHEGYGY